MACSSCGGRSKTQQTQTKRESMVGKVITDNKGNRYEIKRDESGRTKAIKIP